MNSLTKIFLAAIFPIASSSFAKTAPNFIILYVDDLGYADIGSYGGDRARTPELDRMAKEGLQMTSFLAAPVCSASRATLMTGCYAKRIGMPAVMTPLKPNNIHPEERTLPERLKELGYVTEMYGKWHLGDQPESLPTAHGFDYFFGVPYSNNMDWPPAEQGPRKPPLPLVEGTKVIEAPLNQEKFTQQITDKAVNFIKNRKADAPPFLIYLSHIAVHTPHRPGPKFAGKSGKGDYIDWIEEVDASCGAVLKQLRESGIEKDTLVMFASDNGGAGAARNTPLRARKGSNYEGGIRVPCLFWWPGTIPANTSSPDLAATLDVLPTFTSLAGGKAPFGSAERPIDGVDLSELLKDPSKPSPRENFFYFYGGDKALVAIRSKHWKLLIGWPDNKHEPDAIFEPALYNLAKDPGEATNVIAQFPKVVQKLEEMIKELDADIGAVKNGPAIRPSARVKSPTALVKTPE